ncbi:MAG TPA: C1 family peptidase [Lacunisphaera sp.]|jgi:C1A family cysteine protease
MPAKSKINSWYGWTPDRPDYRDKLYATIAAPPKKMPASVDLREGCSPVENQGELGSCTANAIVGNLEFLMKKNGHAVTNLSRLFIYYNERAMEGTVNEDSGAMIRDGVKSLVNLGVCSESKWPYKIAQFKQKPTPACFKLGAEHQLTSYHRVIGLLQMRRCLAEGYPFVFGFSVYEAFESDEVAKSGTLNLPQPGEKQVGGHAVCAVGYDDSTKRILVRNSWGDDWGMKGYFTIPYDYISNGNLADDFWTLRGFNKD